MSFEIQFKLNNSRDNALYKQLDDVVTLTGTLREECSIVEPEILIESTTPVPNCNYAIIPTFGRAYFVTDIEVVRYNLVRVSCKCDVLCSAGSNFENCMGVVRRQENNWNLYLDDGVFQAYSNPIIVTKSFPSGFNTFSYALAVAGS